MGAPRKYKIEDMIKYLTIYIEETPDPMVEEFVLSQPYSRATLYNYAKTSQDLLDTIKNLHHKQEIRTVRGAESGKIPVAFAIFKLKQKQYGWTDKQEQEITIDDKLSKVDSLINQYKDDINTEA